MTHLKFNCHDLDERNRELQSAYRRMDGLVSELKSIFASVEPQIRDYDALDRTLRRVISRSEEHGTQLNKLSNELEQVIEIYHSAERRALQIAQDLPDSLQHYESISGTFFRDAGGLRTATRITMDDSLVIEDWLTQHIYRQNV